MKAKYIPALAAAFFLFFLPPCSAQYQMGQTGLGLYAGMEKLVGGAYDHSNISYFEGFSLKYSFSSLVTSQISISAGWVRPRDPDSHFNVMENAPYKTYIFPWDVNLRLNLLRGKKIVPYIGAGAGLTYWDLRKIDKNSKWFPIPPEGKSETSLQTNITFAALAGIELFLSERVGLDIGVKYSHLLDQTLDNIGTSFLGKGKDINSGFISGFVSLTLFFNPDKDSDNDGIPDKKDLAPFAKEDFDNFQDEDGAPDLDNDKDGIPDVKDKAPNIPEDIDGFQDSDGVPDLDNDNDGIPDLKDKCPNKAEDIDGFQDEDGCPDLDNDNDGIPDTKDQCPDKPETINGYKDNDGCPDTKPESVVPEKGSVLILPEITFTFASANLTNRAKLKLDELADALIKDHSIKLEIRGFTDSIGRASSNIRLSKKRADSVREYLSSKGVLYKQMKTAGYGEANPIASNSTKEGRAKNRRIEFVRID